MRSIGITGTRLGMTAAQTVVIYGLQIIKDGDDVHLGDCVGVDAEAYEVAKESGARTIGHPPIFDKYRANLKYDVMRGPKDYFPRNRDIVNECEVLYAFPKRMYEEQSGGTWYTIHYAAEVKRKTFIVWPDGTLQEWKK